MTTESTLASAARRALRAAAHHLDPVVMIGDKGLTPAVLHEIDIALSAHALIKVRVQSDDREQRVGFMNEICAKLGCESVQHLGKLLVLWRNKEDGDAAALDDDEVNDRPAASARGPRRKLPDVSPRTRAPAGGTRAPVGGTRAPVGAGRARPSGSYAPRGEGFSREGGGYGRSDGTGAPRSAGTGARGATGAGRMTGDAQNRRFRRSDDAPPTDTRTPREGTAPRGRRGAARSETNDRSGEADNRSSFDRRGGGNRNSFSSGDENGDRRGLEGRSSYRNSAARPAPRGGGGHGSADRGGYGSADRGGYGGADRGGSSGGYGGGDSQRRAPSGEGRWGQRGDAGGAPVARPRGGAGGGAGATPKPRARRRLG